MRRRISLYIGGQLVDLDDQSFILFNYALGDLSDPTIVKNSYTQQITIPGTPNNNKIFGHLNRCDRQTTGMNAYRWNQLFDLKPTGSAGYSPSNATYAVNNGVLTITPTSASANATLNHSLFFPSVAGHKYLLYGEFKSSSWASGTALICSVFGQWRLYPNGTNLSTTGWNTLSTIYTETQNGSYLGYFRKNADGNTNPMQIRNLRLFDLTAMGIGNISTYEEFKSWCNKKGRNLYETQPYDPGSVQYYGTSGTKYNPLTKTSFEIYNEMSELIETGYCKVDGITNNNGKTSYKVSLYGGLGSFFYSLAYNEDGTKKTLADLDFLGTNNKETELDFLINAENVRDAWDELEEDEPSGKWSVINFAPAYNGIPSANFSPNKGIVSPSAVGLSSTITKDSKTYKTQSGYTLVSMAENQDEWSVKDLRSYLQRPILSLKAFFNAIAKEENNGGFTLDKSIVDTNSRFPVGNMWMSLPLISSLGVKQSPDDEVELSYSSSATTTEYLAQVDVSGTPPSGTTMEAKVTTTLKAKIPVSSQTILSLPQYVMFYNSSGKKHRKGTTIFLQAVAYGSDDSVIGGSKIIVSSSSLSDKSSSELAEVCGYSPLWIPSTDFYETRKNSREWTREGSDTFVFPGEITFNVDAKNVSYYKIRMTCYEIWETNGSPYKINPLGGIPYLYNSSPTNPLTYTSESVTLTEVESSVYTETPKSLRSGALITKSMLLSSSSSPADYLLSFCKMFGLYFQYDSPTRKITILSRGELYQDETIDISKRIDRASSIDITPFVIETKWYDFALEGIKGRFSEEYETTHGRKYGSQKVNTGYDFNYETKELMGTNVFKDAVTMCDKSKYFNIIFDGTTFKPSPFIDKGNKFTLWSTSGETLDTDISCPPYSASVTYYNDRYPGYDKEFARKVEFRDSSGKTINANNVLLFLEGMEEYEYFKLTDDLPIMDALNDGVPCWLLTPGTSDGVRLPVFGRYTYRSGGYTINSSLDFGVPAELAIPDVVYYDTSTIYARRWKNYLSDRFDVNTKVLKCKVDLSGLNVGNELLRKFFWFDGSLWILNKISNYSLTTYDPVECEFIQIQDKDNYLNGQN